MKPPPFDYHRPASVDEAVRLLAELPGAKVMAGGQSLVPLLNFRLASPPHLVDISRVEELRRITVGEDVRIGAAVTHAEVEHNDRVAEACPLLRQAERLVAHEVIRNRGTAVGSIVHADPAGELTAVLALLRGSVVLRSSDGDRIVGASDFFLGPLEADLRPGELAVEARFPELGPSSGTAFEEVARRHGDYALAGCAAHVALDAGGRIRTSHLSFISVAPTPLTLDLWELTEGGTIADVDAGAVYDLVTAAVDPDPDLHASADYRRHLAGTLAVRALASAADRASAPAPAA
ncbi:MAG: xanthine dehydrogenase family protein subunit M [Actinomycetota bacterium]